MPCTFLRVSTPVATPKEGEHLTGAGLKCQKFNPLSSEQEVWQCADRHGAGVGAESSPSSRLSGSRKRRTVGLTWAFETPKPQ